MAKITRIDHTAPTLAARKRVAAYARVSVDTEEPMESLSAQVSHYSSYIQANPAWEYAGVYADTGISGTGTGKRAEFQRLMQDCRKGLVDIILTKSISRFARNTVDLLKTVRKLRELAISVRFERDVRRQIVLSGRRPKVAKCFGKCSLGMVHLLHILL